MIQPKSIILLTIFLFATYSIAETDQPYKSELAEPGTLAINSISPDTARNIAMTAVQGMLKRAFQEPDSTIQQAIAKTYIHFKHADEPKLLYNEENLEAYIIPLVDDYNMFCDTIVINSYTGKIIKYPSFSGSGISRYNMSIDEWWLPEIKIAQATGITDYKQIRFLRIKTSQYTSQYYFVAPLEKRLKRYNFKQNPLSNSPYIMEEKPKIYTEKIHPDQSSQAAELEVSVQLALDYSGLVEDYVVYEHDSEAALPWKNQEADEDRAQYVNENYNPNEDWNSGISLKCLSYGAASVADWWSHYSNGTTHGTYTGLITGNIEYGCNPRILELMYFDRCSIFDFNFDTIPSVILDDTVTGDDIPIDLKGYCILLTDTNKRYDYVNKKEPLFQNCPAEYYYNFNKSIDLGCGDTYGILPEHPTTSNYQLYKNILKKTGVLYTWNDCTYSKDFWGDYDGHSMAAVGCGYIDEQPVLLMHDNYGATQYYTIKHFNGGAEEGIFQAYYFHYESSCPAPQFYQVNLVPSTDIKITFNEPMKPEIMESTNNPVLSITGNQSYSYSATYDRSSRRLIANPSPDFSYGETVTVVINTLPQDVAGNNISQSSSFTFTIQDEPDDPPTSITVNADSDDTSIDPYQAITISGTAIYNTGDPVDGTATINTGDNIYTAAVIDGSFSRSVTGPSSSQNVYVSISDGSLTGDDSIYISVSGNGSTNNYDLETYVAYNIQDEGDGYCSYSYKDVFTTSNYEVNGLFLIDNANLSSDLDFKLKFYCPDGTQYGSDLEELNAFDKESEWGYWYWGYLINGNLMAYTPGKYKVRFYVDNDRKATHSYVVGWNFTEHLMCKSADTGDPWMYHDPTNVFSTEDAKAVAWHEFEDVGQEIYVKTNYYGPDGSLYLVGNEHLCEFNLPADHWYDWYRYYQTMTIKGAAPEFMCGNWTVKFYVKNPSSGAWEQKYTDVFRIQENIVPTITYISALPVFPIETQDVTVNISAADNNHLKKLVLHWNDGTEHTQTWDNINSSSIVESYNIGSFSSGILVEYWAEVWDESGNRSESGHNTIMIAQETITTPNQPTGDVFVQVGESTSYTTGGSTSSLGHSVQYQYDWGDGTQSTWNGTSQSKSWSTENYYFVKAHARCQTHTSRISDWSNSLMVTVDSTNPTVAITTNNGNDYTAFASVIVLEGVIVDPGVTSGIASVSINTSQENEGTLSNWKFTVPLNEGNNVFTVTASDRCGNSSQDTINIFVPQGTLRLELLYPVGGERLSSNRYYTILWDSGLSDVFIEYSINGTDWLPVSPPNMGNSGQYEWLVPEITSDQCFIRITDASNSLLYDVFDVPFKIYPCNLPDLTGDCVIDLEDLCLMVSEWLGCGNPFSPECL